MWVADKDGAEVARAKTRRELEKKLEDLHSPQPPLNYAWCYVQAVDGKPTEYEARVCVGYRHPYGTPYPSQELSYRHLEKTHVYRVVNTKSGRRPPEETPWLVVQGNRVLQRYSFKETARKHFGRWPATARGPGDITIFTLQWPTAYVCHEDEARKRFPDLESL